MRGCGSFRGSFRGTRRCFRTHGGVRRPCQPCAAGQWIFDRRQVAGIKEVDEKVGAEVHGEGSGCRCIWRTLFAVVWAIRLVRGVMSSLDEHPLPFIEFSSSGSVVCVCVSMCLYCVGAGICVLRHQHHKCKQFAPHADIEHRCQRKDPKDVSFSQSSVAKH